MLTFEFDSDHDRRSAREPRSGKVGAVGGEPLRKLIRLVASIHCPSETLSAFTCEPNLNGRCCAQVTPPDLVVRLPWHDPHIVSRPHVLDHYLVRLSGPVPYVTKDCEMSSKEATQWTAEYRSQHGIHHMVHCPKPVGIGRAHEAARMEGRSERRARCSSTSNVIAMMTTNVQIAAEMTPELSLAPLVPPVMS